MAGLARVSKWKKTKHPGVRYREHPARKNGVQKDRYFSIYYTRQGKRREEGLGWASEGWTAEKAALQRSELKKAQLTGIGPQTLREKRAQEEARRQHEEAKKEKKKLKSLTFGQVFESYFALAKTVKAEKSWKREQQLFQIWISKAIGSKPMVSILPLHIEEIKQHMQERGQSPRSIEYAIAVVRQVFNFAKSNSLFQGDSPTARVVKPKKDNRRVRFLTHEEAKQLLEALAVRSRDVHDMALLSLETGMRLGEIFSLTWNDLDLNKGKLILLDTKNGKTRTAYLTENTKKMLQMRRRSRAGDSVFCRNDGKPYRALSRTFERTVDDLGFNDGIEDARMKVVFHTLRHTYASWLVEKGVDLYTVKELLGHSTLQMTERYSHITEKTLRQAVKELEKDSRPL